MGDMSYIICYLILIVSVVVFRIVLGRVFHGSETKWRLLDYSIMFAAYCVILQTALFLTYSNLPANSGSEECYAYMAFCCLGINIAVFFVVAAYYMVRSKRKMSGIEKMRLKDI